MTDITGKMNGFRGRVERRNNDEIAKKTGRQKKSRDKLVDRGVGQKNKFMKIIGEDIRARDVDKDMVLWKDGWEIYE